MSLKVEFPLALGRFKRLPQRAGEVWQGGLVRLPAWIDDPDAPDVEPVRPMAALWVSLRTGLVHLELPAEGAPASADLALSALLEFGLKWSKGLDGRPARVEVRDAALRDALAEPLARLDTSVAVVDELPALRDFLRNLEASTTGRPPLPGLLESPGVTLDRVRAFAAAAAAFYEARIWDHLANEDLLVADGNGIPRAMRHAVVLGQGGHQFGLSFFESRAAFERVFRLADVGRATSRAHGIIYGPIDELPFTDVDAWQDHGLPVAGARAYPLLADLRRSGEVRRPDAAQLNYAEALLRALADTSEDELDAGRWHKRVDTFDGPVELRLTLPVLVEADAGLDRAPRAAAMPRIAERAGVRIARMVGERAFESLEDLNEEIARANQLGLFDGSPEASLDRDLTPLERAQELAYDANEAEGRLRIKRARQALAVSPDCADAWVILAEAASTPERALEYYERGVAAGTRAIGAGRFEELTGEFWGHLETRPYMRARFGLARTLRQLGRIDDAIAHCRELLRLNPGDNQGVRFFLLVQLLELDRDAEAGALLQEHAGEIQAVWAYGRVLWMLRTEGDTPRTRAALAEARRRNRHVPKYLLDPEASPAVLPSHFALGSREEAAFAAEELEPAYRATPGAIPWLRLQMKRRG